jgi:hypothetical protein
VKEKDARFTSMASSPWFAGILVMMWPGLKVCLSLKSVFYKEIKTNEQTYHSKNKTTNDINQFKVNFIN